MIWIDSKPNLGFNLQKKISGVSIGSSMLVNQQHKPLIWIDGSNPTHEIGKIGDSLTTGWWLKNPSEKYESQWG